MVKQQDDVQLSVTRADKVSRKLTQKIDTEVSENRIFIRKHATMVKLHASLTEDARRVQGNMKETIDEVERYQQQSDEYDKWLEVSTKSAALKEPIGSEASMIRRQLTEVEVSTLMNLRC